MALREMKPEEKTRIHFINNQNSLRIEIEARPVKAIKAHYGKELK